MASLELRFLNKELETLVASELAELGASSLCSDTTKMVRPVFYKGRQAFLKVQDAACCARDEIRALKDLEGIEGVPSLVDHVDIEWFHLIFLEYIDGMSLDDIRSGRTYVDSFRRVLDIVDRCHERGIAHRDVNDTNMMIGSRLYLIDFDLSMRATRETIEDDWREILFYLTLGVRDRVKKQSVNYGYPIAGECREFLEELVQVYESQKHLWRSDIEKFLDNYGSDIAEVLGEDEVLIQLGEEQW